MRNIFVLPRALFLLALGSPAFAQTPLGPELPVHVETESAQRFSRVAMNARGELVASWVSADPRSSEGLSLFVRRFEADGTPATGEIRVSTQGLDRFEPAALAMMEDGSFLVVRPTARGLEARRYAPDGSPVGRDILVTRSMGPQFRVVSRGDGSFVVVWEGNPPSIRARAFRADGEPRGPELVVDRSGNSPEVAAGPDGELVVIWKDPVAAGGSGESEFVVRGQRLAADGRRQGRMFAVSPKDTRFVRYDVAKDADGDFLVVWAQGSFRLGPGTFGRWYAQDGTPRTGVLRLLDKALPIELAMDARGNFVLAWEDFAVLSQLDVFGQRFTSGGRPFRPVFRANTITSGNQKAPNVASDAAGNFVLVWEGPDEHGSVDVFARLFRRR